MTTESYGREASQSGGEYTEIFLLALLGELTINSTRKFRLIARIHHNVFRYGLDSCTICLDVGAYVGVGMTQASGRESEAE